MNGRRGSLIGVINAITATIILVVNKPAPINSPKAKPDISDRNEENVVKISGAPFPRAAIVTPATL